MTHVLVLDDDQPCRDTMRDSLEAAGFDVTAVSGLEEVANVLRGVRPNCIVVATTLVTGRESAIDLVRTTRAADPKVGIVIVANGDIDLVEKEISGLDVWAVVEKPGDLEKLPDKVERACEFAAIPVDTKAKLADDLEMQTMMFQRVKRETRRIQTERILRPRDD